MIFFVVHYLLSAPTLRVGTLWGGCFLPALLHVAPLLFPDVCYWKEEFMVAVLWALIFRFCVIRKQALMYLLGIKQTQKHTRTWKIYFTLDFLLTLSITLLTFLDKVISQELTDWQWPERSTFSEWRVAGWGFFSVQWNPWQVLAESETLGQLTVLWWW